MAEFSRERGLTGAKVDQVGWHKHKTVSVLAAVALLGAATLQGKTLPSREDILAVAFPGSTWRAERIFLSEAQRSAAGRLSGVEIPSALIARYQVFQAGRRVGRAYVDTHVVRTKKETLIVCLDEAGQVKRIEATAFLEPHEYIAPDPWYAQYRDRRLGDDLNLQRSIRPIAGATLTAMATNQAVRRVLAIDQVLERQREERE